MTSRWLFAALAFTTLVSARADASPRRYLTPSEVLAQTAALDGKKITVGGVIDLGTNSRCIYDSLSAYRERRGDGAAVLTLSEGDRLLQRKAELNHRFVIVTGTFKRVFNGPETLDLYQCNGAGIEQDTVRRSSSVR
jgi:hypothetical protein